MSPQDKSKHPKSIVSNWILLGISSIATVVLLHNFPDQQQETIAAFWKFIVEMFAIFPAVLVLMGLFSVWTSKNLVIKYLGKESGAKGIVLSLFFGALPAGPLYVAFPLAAALRKKGASISNIVIFLSAWACIKIPQEMIELQFLGLRFMAARLVLTILFVTLMGLLIEKIMNEKRHISTSNT